MNGKKENMETGNPAESQRKRKEDVSGNEYRHILFRL